MKAIEEKIILASKSPRRQQLLKELGLDFEIQLREVDESFPAQLKREEIPMFLAKQKSEAFQDVPEDHILLTSDTIVWINETVLNKPENEEGAIQMLKTISGKMHEVITAVYLRSSNLTRTFYVVTDVHFKKLSNDEINYYVKEYKPFDKAGAYGIQEWIGFIGIERINGSFYNVMGLPVKEVYEELISFSKKLKERKIEKMF
jgi:septum formation protein